MKTQKYFPILILAVISIAVTSCNYIEADFGFDAAIQGSIKDNSGNLLYGDINSNNVIVRMLGENDLEPIDIRLNGDGTFQNLRMYPKRHKAWVEGPIAHSDTITVDFSSSLIQNVDFSVDPLVLPKIINGSSSGTSIIVDYTVVPTGSNTVAKNEIYCSTVKYPTASIGSMTNVYTTKTVALPTLTGTATITGLTSGTKYYLRIGAQAGSSKLMNYSNQIEVPIP
jgi:hypothetical protein